MRGWISAVLVLATGCAGAAIRPADVAKLQAGQHVRVHVWPEGAPGPGYYVSGDYEGDQGDRIVVKQSGKRVEIFKRSIHDDTLDATYR
jgi:hypothetical protein